MTTGILYPASDASVPAGFVTDTGATTNRYARLQEGTASPNDSSYVVSPGGAVTIYFGLGSIFVDVVTVTAVTIAIRVARSGSKGDFQSWVTCRLFKSDMSTPLTAMSSIIDSTSLTTYTFSPSLSGSVTKADWNNAVLALTLGVGTVAGAKINAAQVAVTYTPVAATRPLLRCRRMMMEA